MNILTTDTIPLDVTVQELYGLVEITYPLPLEISKWISSPLAEAKRNEHHREALVTFVDAVRNLYPKANFVIGTKVSTAVGSFSNGTFLYITYIGTPVFAG